MAGEINEPIPPMRQAAVGLHELYKMLQTGGFTKSEALYIVGVSLANSRNEDAPPPAGS